MQREPFFGRITFQDRSAPLRTGDSFAPQTQEEQHKGVTIPEDWDSNGVKVSDRLHASNLSRSDTQDDIAVDEGTTVCKVTQAAIPCLSEMKLFLCHQHSILTGLLSVLMIASIKQLCSRVVR